MDCVKPVLVNGIRFACGRCKACRITRTSMWSLRLLHEKEYWEKSCFVTLTYDDEHLPIDEGLDKPEFQRFMKRLRKNTKRKIKYFASGEYGEKCKVCGLNHLSCQCTKFIEDVGRPHYHAILFGFSQDEKEIIEENWYCGMVHVGTCTKDSIKYVASYIQKKWTGQKAIDEYKGKAIPFQVCSQGLGARWMEDNKQRLYSKMYITRNGIKCPLPKYYKDKLGINSEQTIGYQIEALAETRRWFDERGIPPDARSKYEDERAKQKLEELTWLEQNKTKPKAL